jgi:uncharacterized membrane protein
MEIKENKKKKALIAASIAGLLTVSAGVIAPSVAQAEAVPCYGVNACKGTGDCGGKGNGCAGKNSCKGEGYVSLEKETCLKINNGSLTPKTA